MKITHTTNIHNGLTEDEVYEKACRALWRKAQREGYAFDQPSRSVSYWDGDVYVLRNMRGELGKYRLTATGRIQAVSR